jgi:hypothetical protein
MPLIGAKVNVYDHLSTAAWAARDTTTLSNIRRPISVASTHLVPPAGIEPAAFPLGGGRSIHWATGARAPEFAGLHRACQAKSKLVLPWQNIQLKFVFPDQMGLTFYFPHNSVKFRKLGGRGLQNLISSQCARHAQALAIEPLFWRIKC